jgi:pimeloyl-ACP methyl ester carboxylesterase
MLLYRKYMEQMKTENMESGAVPSINEIFRERNQEFVEDAAERLHTSKSVEVNGMNIDYRRVFIPEARNAAIDANKQAAERFKQVAGGQLEVLLSERDRKYMTTEQASVEAKKYQSRAERLESDNVFPVLYLQGFGSGWEGNSELPFSAACEGRDAIVMSLPGYGNSDNPQSEYYKGKTDFAQEAEVVEKFLQQIGVGKVHLVGHSMGAEIIAELAKKSPELAASVTLLNPPPISHKETGVVGKTKSAIVTAVRFGLGGAAAQKSYKEGMKRDREVDYQKPLQEKIQATSPFSISRIMQRISEVLRLVQGERIKKFLEETTVPVQYISGSRDMVYPPGEMKNSGDKATESQVQKLSQIHDGNRIAEITIVKGGHHNMTQSMDEIIAAQSNHFQDEVEDEIFK